MEFGIGLPNQLHQFLPLLVCYFELHIHTPNTFYP